MTESKNIRTNFSFKYKDEDQFQKLRKWHKGLTATEAVLEAFQVFPVVDDFDDLYLFKDIDSLDKFFERLELEVYRRDYPSLDKCPELNSLYPKVKMYNTRYPDCFFLNMQQALSNIGQLKQYRNFLTAASVNIEHHEDYPFEPSEEELADPVFLEHAHYETYYDIESLRNWFSVYIHPPKHWKNPGAYIASPFSSRHKTKTKGRTSDKKKDTLNILFSSSVLLTLKSELDDCFHEESNFNISSIVDLLYPKLPAIRNKAMELDKVSDATLKEYVEKGFKLIEKAFYESEFASSTSLKEYILSQVK